MPVGGIRVGLAGWRDGGLWEFVVEIGIENGDVERNDALEGGEESKTAKALGMRSRG